MSDFILRRVQPADLDWVTRAMVATFGAEIVVSRGQIQRPSDLPGFIAEVDGERLALATYRIDGDECELVSIHSDRPGLGLGSALVDAVRSAAIDAGCRRLWLITTNDNIAALRWYQRRAFVLAALHRDTMVNARRLKPEIPLIGSNGIPMRDEIELEMRLKRSTELKKVPSAE